jgi:hypothetical protein
MIPAFKKTTAARRARQTGLPMSVILRFPRRHVRASTAGRATSDGHSPSGQWSENQRKASSSRPTVMSAPSSKARSFLPSLSARDDTVDKGTFSSFPYRCATRSKSSRADMDAISVDVPVMSTVNLPDAQTPVSGHPTGMDLKVLLANIDRLKRDMSDNALSMKAGKEDAIRNLRRYDSGELKGMWTLETLDKIAKALGTSSWELLRPPGALAVDNEETVRSIVRDELQRSAATKSNTPKKTAAKHRKAG